MGGRFPVVMGLAALAMLAGCGSSVGGGRSYPPYRYRLTVSVDTPQGVRSGSSVVEVKTSVSGSQSIPSPHLTSFRIRGEAVAVDLPNGQTLFTLLRSDESVEWAALQLSMHMPPQSSEETAPAAGEDEYLARYDASMQRIMALKGVFTVSRWLPPDHPGGEPRNGYPMLVRFRDIRNPKTVERVDPDNLAASFGPGYKLRRITVEPTEDKPVFQIASRFPWWEEYRDRHFDGSPTTSENPFEEPRSWLSTGWFSTEQ